MDVAGSGRPLDAPGRRAGTQGPPARMLAAPGAGISGCSLVRAVAGVAGVAVRGSGTGCPGSVLAVGVSFSGQAGRITVVGRRASGWVTAGGQWVAGLGVAGPRGAVGDGLPDARELVAGGGQESQVVPGVLAGAGAV